MENEPVQVLEEKIITGKTVISFKSPTPMWATWTFRIVFLFTTAATFVIAGEPSIPDEMKVRIGLYLKGLDVVIWGMGKGIGIEKEQFHS